MGTVLPFQLLPLPELEPNARLGVTLPGLESVQRGAISEVRSLDLHEAHSLASEAQVLQTSLLSGLLADLRSTADAAFSEALSGVRAAAFGLLGPTTERSLAQAVFAEVLSTRPYAQRRQAALTTAEVFGAFAKEECLGPANDPDSADVFLEAGLHLCLLAEPGSSLPPNSVALLHQGGRSAQDALLAIVQCGVEVDPQLHEAMAAAALELSDDELRTQLPSLLALLDVQCAKHLLERLVVAEKLLPVFHALRFAPHLVDDH